MRMPVTRPIQPPWLAIAMLEGNVIEAKGAADNPRIVEYLRTCAALPPELLHDSTAWCAAFVNWCFRRAGITGTNSARARDWLTWGQPLQQPRLGCVAVFSRDEAGPRAGHVAFYVSETARKDIHVYGGNQDNRVCLQPRERARLLGYRWPRDEQWAG